MNIDDFPFKEFAQGKSEDQLVEHINSLAEISETIIGGKKYTSSAKVSKEDRDKILKIYIEINIIDESYLSDSNSYSGWKSVEYGNGTFAVISDDGTKWNISK